MAEGRWKHVQVIGYHSLCPTQPGCVKGPLPTAQPATLLLAGTRFLCRWQQRRQCPAGPLSDPA